MLIKHLMWILMSQQPWEPLQFSIVYINTNFSFVKTPCYHSHLQNKKMSKEKMSKNTKYFC